MSVFSPLTRENCSVVVDDGVHLHIAAHGFCQCACFDVQVFNPQ